MPIGLTYTPQEERPSFFSKFPAEGKIPVYLVNLEDPDLFYPLSFVNTFYVPQDGSPVTIGKKGVFFGFIPTTDSVSSDYAHLKGKVVPFVVNMTLTTKILEKFKTSFVGNDISEPFHMALEPSTPNTRLVHLMVLSVTKNKSGVGFVPDLFDVLPSKNKNEQYIQEFKSATLPYPSLQEAEWAFNAMSNGLLKKHGLTQHLQPVKPIENEGKSQMLDPFNEASEEDTF